MHNYNQSIHYCGNIGGENIFYASDYILVDQKRNKYYSGYFKYGVYGEIIPHYRGKTLFNDESETVMVETNYNNGIQIGSYNITRIKKENGKMMDKTIKLNLKANNGNVATNRIFNGRRFNQKCIDVDTNIDNISVNMNYNKFLLIFHGNENGRLENKKVNFKNVVDKLSNKVKRTQTKNCLTKIKLVSCFGTLNDAHGNNLLNCIQQSFNSPVVVSIANPKYETSNITLQDRKGVVKKYTYPVDYSQNSGKLISKYLSGTLNEQERIDYKNKYFNHFYIDKGQIYQIDYSFYNMIKYMSKDDIETNLQFGLADKHENVKKVLPDLSGKYGFRIVKHSVPTNNTKQIFNNIEYNFANY